RAAASTYTPVRAHDVMAGRALTGAVPRSITSATTTGAKMARMGDLLSPRASWPQAQGGLLCPSEGSEGLSSDDGRFGGPRGARRGTTESTGRWAHHIPPSRPGDG